MKFIGAHVSIAGGVENAPLNAHAIGATGFALFTKNQRQWQAPPLTESAIAAFKNNCRKYGYTPAGILPHDSYLLNLCQPDPAKLAVCRDSFTEELRRCQQLGLDRLNFHPGSHLNVISVAEGIRLIGESVRLAVDAVPGVKAVFEITAGQGSNLGSSFDELAAMLEATDRPDRVGICLDTCHAYAAGYDLKSEEGYASVMDELERKIGFRYLLGVHLNDSKSVLGGHLDRHHSLGKGELGWDLFRRMMQDRRLDGIPLILETIDETRWSAEIAQLREFCGN